MAAIAVVATQFVNCTDQSEGSSLYGNACVEGTSCAQSLTVENPTGYLNPRSTQPIMECTHDHIQVGGSCEVGLSTDSYIEYYLTDAAGNRIQWANGVDILREARCENGRFFMIIPRPPSTIVPTSGPGDLSVCSTATCMREYRLNSRLFALRKGTNQFEVVANAPILPLQFQLVLQHSGGSFCP